MWMTWGHTCLYQQPTVKALRDVSFELWDMTTSASSIKYIYCRVDSRSQRVVEFPFWYQNISIIYVQTRSGFSSNPHCNCVHTVLFALWYKIILSYKYKLRLLISSPLLMYYCRPLLFLGSLTGTEQYFCNHFVRSLLVRRWLLTVSP